MTKLPYWIGAAVLLTARLPGRLDLTGQRSPRRTT